MAKKNKSSTLHYDKMATICKPIFEKKRKAVRGAASDPVYSVINELSVDFDGPRFDRRLDATVRSYSMALDIAQRNLPHSIRERFHTLDDWCHLNSLPFRSLDTLNELHYFTLAAAIWIMDVLAAYNLTDDAIAYLPQDQDTLKEVAIDGFWDPCHSLDVLKGMVYVIDHRNDDCVGKRTDSDSARKRVLLDDFTATNTQHQDVPSRKRFEAILSLIPKADLNEAMHNYRAAVIGTLERYYRLQGKIYADLFVCSDKLDQLEAEHELRTAGQNPSPALNPILFQKKDDAQIVQYPKAVKDSIASKELFPAKVGYMGQIVSEINDTKNFRDSLISLSHEYDKLRDKADRLLVLSSSNFLWSRNHWVNEIGEEYADIMLSFAIEDPFEICFAYLYLLDSNDDLPWLMYSSTCILNYCAAMLPWNYDHPESVDDADDESDEEGFLSPYAFTSEFEDGTRTSLARSIFDLTGCLLPRDPQTYDAFGTVLSDQYGIEGEEQQKALAYLTILASVCDQTKLPYEQLYKDASLTVTDKEHEIADLTATIAKLKAENDALKKDLHSEEQKNRILEQKADDIEQQRKLELLELSDLRELVYLQGQESTSENEPSDERIAFPYTVTHRTVVFGGHDSWARAIKPLLPGTRFFLHAAPQPDVIRNSDVVWIQANSLSHANFYKIIDVVRANNVPIRYFRFASAEKCAMQLAEYDMSLSQAGKK